MAMANKNMEHLNEGNETGDFITKLTQDMTEGTQTITVEDGDVLPTPNAANNIPGVVFIDKERIEYFTKSSNTL